MEQETDTPEPLRPKEFIKLPKLVEQTLNMTDTNLRADDLLSLLTIYKDINELHIDHFKFQVIAKKLMTPCIS